jgi:hypothetical protein
MRMGGSLTSGRGHERYRLPYAGLCSIGTVVAASRAVAWPSVRGIISGIGLEVGPLRSRISRFCVGGTIEPCMRSVIESSVSQTVRSSSGVRMAGLFLMCRPRPRWRVIRWICCDPATKGRRDRSTRLRRSRGGAVSGWMWVGRSTCCIHWLREPGQGEGRSPLAYAFGFTSLRYSPSELSLAAGLPRRPASQWRCLRRRGPRT